VGLLFVDGQLVRELAPGVHAFWKIGRNVRVERFACTTSRVHDKLAALGIDLTEIGVNELARITL
jgi:hypothetical protein